MTTNIALALREFESFVRNGKATSFSVLIQQDGLLLRSAGNEKELKVNLNDEQLQPLKVFFLGINSIDYRSFDYTNLNCFLYTNSLAMEKTNQKSRS